MYFWRVAVFTTVRGLSSLVMPTLLAVRRLRMRLKPRFPLALFVMALAYMGAASDTRNVHHCSPSKMLTTVRRLNGGVVWRTPAHSQEFRSNAGLLFGTCLQPVLNNYTQCGLPLLMPSRSFAHHCFHHCRRKQHCWTLGRFRHKAKQLGPPIACHKPTVTTGLLKLTLYLPQSRYRH